MHRLAATASVLLLLVLTKTLPTTTDFLHNPFTVPPELYLLL